MIRRFSYFLLLLVTFVSPAFAVDSLITFLPKKKFVPAFTASGTEHRISYNKQLTRGIIIGSMGGVFPVADVRYSDAEHTSYLVCQVSAASSVYTTLHSAGVKYRVTTVDFYVDIFFDIPLSHTTVLRAGWGHTSHHLADDAMLPGINAVNYARDYYDLFVVQKISEIGGFAYGGVYWTYSFLINKNIGRKLLPEFGAEGNLINITNDIALYAAADLKFRGELNYGSTQSYQVGVKAQNEDFRVVRVAYTFRTGVEERGQFYNLRNKLHTIGVFFDF